MVLLKRLGADCVNPLVGSFEHLEERAVDEGIASHFANSKGWCILAIEPDVDTEGDAENDASEDDDE